MLFCIIIFHFEWLLSRPPVEENKTVRYDRTAHGLVGITCTCVAHVQIEWAVHKAMGPVTFKEPNIKEISDALP